MVSIASLSFVSNHNTPPEDGAAGDCTAPRCSAKLSGVETLDGQPYEKQGNAKTDDDWTGVHTSTMHSKSADANQATEDSTPL